MPLPVRPALSVPARPEPVTALRSGMTAIRRKPYKHVYLVPVPDSERLACQLIPAPD